MFTGAGFGRGSTSSSSYRTCACLRDFQGTCPLIVCDLLPLMVMLCPAPIRKPQTIHGKRLTERVLEYYR